ncbi:MAG: hypothetical protein HEQ19_01735 [Gloeotrichia echinulata CP02]
MGIGDGINLLITHYSLLLTPYSLLLGIGDCTSAPLCYQGLWMGMGLIYSLLITHYSLLLTPYSLLLGIGDWGLGANLRPVRE